MPTRVAALAVAAMLAAAPTLAVADGGSPAPGQAPPGASRTDAAALPHRIEAAALGMQGRWTTRFARGLRQSAVVLSGGRAGPLGFLASGLAVRSWLERSRSSGGLRPMDLVMIGLVLAGAVGAAIWWDGRTRSKRVGGDSDR